MPDPRDDEGMDKYSVVVDDDMEKQAREGDGCPVCGSTVDYSGNVPVCPRCGTAPFEKRPEGK